MSIYTKTGDQGQTSLASGSRVSKTDPRIEAYGTVDELNSWIGALRAEIANSQQLTANSQLDWIQNKLFNLGAALSEAPGNWIDQTDVNQLEAWIDAMQAIVPKQRAFILPMGGEAVTRAHICRTVCRRAERRMIEANADPIFLRFINRLSDYLFVLARLIAHQDGETEYMWKN